MGNTLKIEKREILIGLFGNGWSIRKINKATGIHRKSISTYREAWEAGKDSEGSGHTKTMGKPSMSRDGCSSGQPAPPRGGPAGQSVPPEARINPPIFVPYGDTSWRMETFIRLHERAFDHFGGGVEVVKLDNLKSAVLRAHLYEPEMNPTYLAFSQHMGFVPLPCKVGMPEHKGKVEAGIKYIQNNALKGKSFKSLPASPLGAG